MFLNPSAAKSQEDSREFCGKRKCWNKSYCQRVSMSLISCLESLNEPDWQQHNDEDNERCKLI